MAIASALIAVMTGAATSRSMPRRGGPAGTTTGGIAGDSAVGRAAGLAATSTPTKGARCCGEDRTTTLIPNPAWEGAGDGQDRDRTAPALPAAAAAGDGRGGRWRAVVVLVMSLSGVRVVKTAAPSSTGPDRRAG